MPPHHLDAGTDDLATLAGGPLAHVAGDGGDQEALATLGGRHRFDTGATEAEVGFETLGSTLRADLDRHANATGGPGEGSIGAGRLRGSPAIVSVCRAAHVDGEDMPGDDGEEVGFRTLTVADNMGDPVTREHRGGGRPGGDKV